MTGFNTIFCLFGSGYFFGPPFISVYTAVHLAGGKNGGRNPKREAGPYLGVK